jgi:5-oxoprolinase (ATP-hydrolysing)
MGYYETIGGGSGAGPSWHGKSGVQVHMTNTRITDIEIIERRYPVMIEEFSIRKNSGGKGKFNGGDGIVRIFRFLDKLNVSILSERRVFAPFGIEGGEDGQKGLNLYVNSKINKIFNIGAKNTINVNPGDAIIIMTPGGGGYGKKENKEDTNIKISHDQYKNFDYICTGSISRYFNDQYNN